MNCLLVDKPNCLQRAEIPLLASLASFPASLIPAFNDGNETKLHCFQFSFSCLLFVLTSFCFCFFCLFVAISVRWTFANTALTGTPLAWRGSYCRMLQTNAIYSPLKPPWPPRWTLASTSPAWGEEREGGRGQGVYRRKEEERKEEEDCVENA